MRQKSKPLPDRCRTAVVLADERALLKICGISLVERLLRHLQRLGFAEAHVLCANETVAQQVSRPSWARAALAVQAVEPGATLPETPRFLLVSGSHYHDPRLLEALSEQEQTTVLIDSSPAAPARICGAALIENDAFPSQPLEPSLFDRLAARSVLSRLDVETQPRYLVDLRREIRPLWFPPPNAAATAKVERLLLNAAQNGTLDLPAKLHAPIETWLVARLCRTQITPNQITLFTAVVSATTTALFSSGRLLTGTVFALLVGIFDGLDGKQARVKVETTKLGKREHALDYVLELSWWTALAYHFSATRQLAHAYILLALLVAADLLDRLAKQRAKHKTGRNLDDVAAIDRFVRLVGGRRNIYIWIFAAGLALGVAHQAFVALCCWGAATAAVHVSRSWWLQHTARVGRHRLPH